MRLTASDFYTYLRPSKCDLRVFLRHKGAEEAPPGPYEEVLRRLGQRHERAHLETLGPFADLSKEKEETRDTITKLEVRKRAPVIYQGMLRATTDINGVSCEIVGEPDFLLTLGGGYAIRDSKISRRITEDDHPEILLQLQLYGWLFERTFGERPRALQVHTGAGRRVDIPYDRGASAISTLGNLLSIKRAKSDPYSPVGWSKCSDCAFHDRCWPRAEASRDVALVAGVDQGLAMALRSQGVSTVDQFLGMFNEEELANLQRPWGNKTQRVGKKAVGILRMARAMASGREEILEAPALPDQRNFVMFDLEGLPPHLDDLEKIYLWGLQVFGDRPSEYVAATAGFGADGDRQGWMNFLQKAGAIFEQYGNVPGCARTCSISSQLCSVR